MKVNSPGAAVEKAAGDGIKAWNSGGSHLLARRVIQFTMFLVGFAVLWMFLYTSASPFGFPTFSHYFIDDSPKVSLFLSLYLHPLLSLYFCVSTCVMQLGLLVVVKGGE